MDTEQLILKHIRENLLEGLETLVADTSLFQGQILDSMKLVELLSFLETQFGFRANPMDITIDNFDTAHNIAVFVSKQERNDRP